MQNSHLIIIFHKIQKFSFWWLPCEARVVQAKYNLLSFGSAKMEMSEMSSPIDNEWSYLVWCWWIYSQTLNTPNKPNIPNIVPVHKKKIKKLLTTSMEKYLRESRYLNFLMRTIYPAKTTLVLGLLIYASVSFFLMYMICMYMICQSFYCNPPLDVTSTFLDISKVFDLECASCIQMWMWYSSLLL